ncbi:hypothetical protein D8Y22_08965 [Salinadaptatus halalkaliphilus]|uniref:Uncharacterized protein n=1 Tax=Salinadaptatus halalkaliphilus TaxID=2419781 RepID=A0A4S3TM63_9EURY|nr:hypothetical protein [Salinadaptatus halalkaliphilus]THE65311.1 hypothetical protein D8Y22_08965 [Salinadaptatus halalkaliphilus]
MSLAGPRLDRPSAIGDEGRPRAASLAIATLVVVALAVAGGVAIGEPSLVTVLGTVAGLTVAGIGLLERTGFVPQAVGYAFIVTFGSAFALLVVIGPVFGRVGLVVVGVAFSLLGLGMAWADVDSDGLLRATAGCALTYGSLLVSLLFVGLGAAIVALAWAMLGLVTTASTPAASLVGLLVVLAGVTLCVLLGLWLVPIRQLTPRSRRERVDERLATLRRVLAGCFVGSIGTILLIATLWVTGLFGQLVALVGPLEVGLRWLSSPVVIWPLVGAGLLVVAVGVASATVRQGAQQLGGEGSTWSVAILVGASLVGAGVLVVAVVFVGAMLGTPAPGALLAGLAPLVAGVVLLFGPFAFLLVFGGLVVSIAIGLVPARAAGPALTAAGLVLAAIGLSASHPIFVFACLAGAVLVWDVSTFGLGVTAELGHMPASRRLELVHGVLSTGLAISAVVLALGLEIVRTGVFGGVGGTAGLLAVGVGTLLVLLPLRG